MFLINEKYSKNWALRTVNTCQWDVNTTTVQAIQNAHPSVTSNITEILLNNIYLHPLAKNPLSLGVYKQFDDGSNLFTLYETTGKKLLSGRRFINDIDQCSATIEITDLLKFIINQYGDHAVMSNLRMWLYTATLT